MKMFTGQIKTGLNTKRRRLLVYIFLVAIIFPYHNCYGMLWKPRALVSSIIKNTRKKHRFYQKRSHKTFKGKRRFYQTKSVYFKKFFFRFFSGLAHVGLGLFYFFPDAVVTSIEKWWYKQDSNLIVPMDLENIQYQVLVLLGIKTYSDLFRHIEKTANIKLTPMEKRNITSIISISMQEGKKNIMIGTTSIHSLFLLPFLVHNFQTEKENISEDYIPRFTALTFSPVLYDGTDKNPLVDVLQTWRTKNGVSGLSFIEFQSFISDPIADMSNIREERKDALSRSLWDLFKQKKYEKYFGLKELLVIKDRFEAGEPKIFSFSDTQKGIIKNLFEKTGTKEEVLAFSKIRFRAKKQRLLFPPYRSINVFSKVPILNESLYKTWFLGELTTEVIQLIERYQD